MSAPDRVTSAQQARKFAIGVDVGGTFTDLVLADLRKSELHRFKTLTTPDEPSRGVIEGLTRLAADIGIAAADIGYVVHATTLVANAIIERKGALTGLLTTAGMRDVLEIGRESRYDLYDLYLAKPTPLVPRPLRLEVNERLRADGSVHLPLDLGSVETAARALIGHGVRAVAVCLINSYRNQAHELAVKNYLARRFPELDVSISSEISREAGEYERTSTTVANAYVRPMVRGYLRELAAELEETVQFSREHGFKHILNNQRAQAFYSKWLSQYGDDSIAQM
ncbi:MAG: hydantoinase/oxoprolinase family protein, partial [Armatimonadetes bacterium]|nr:hydantoinase/oxoprolinase family protein [Armatimonadota bacterium]